MSSTGASSKVSGASGPSGASSQPSTPHSSAARSAHNVLGVTFGRYEGLMRLAAGGMGQVLVARVQSERGVRRLVALKTILSHLTDNDLFLKMFVREAEIASRLHHPNVVPVLELGRTEQEHFLVMEYFPSVPLNSVLKEALKKQKPMPHDVAAAIVADAAGGLHAAHELTDDDGQLLHLVHRDATPSNLLVGADGSVKVTDFGVAKATGAQFENMTVSGDLRGKIGYLSPEQVTGEKLDRRSDVFTLGIVLWECLAGRRLFGRKDSEVAAIRALMDERIPDVREAAPTVPEPLARITARALDRDPAKRFQSAAELRQALTTQLLADTDAHRMAFAKETIGEILAERQRTIASAVAELDSPTSIAKKRSALTGAPSEATSVDPHSAVSLDSSAAAGSKTVPPPPQQSSRLGLAAGALGLLLLGGGGALLASGALKSRPHNGDAASARPNAPSSETPSRSTPTGSNTRAAIAVAASDAGAAPVIEADASVVASATEADAATTVASAQAAANHGAEGVEPASTARPARSGRARGTRNAERPAPPNNSSTGTTTAARPPERIEM